jgi:hypothetical protein
MSDRGHVTLYGNGPDKRAKGHGSAAPPGAMQLSPVATDSRPQQLSDLEAGSQEAIALVKMHTTEKELVEQQQRHPTRQQKRLTPASWLESLAPQTARPSGQVPRDLRNKSSVTERPGAEKYGAHTSSAPQTSAQIVRLRSEGLVSLQSGFASRQQLKASCDSSSRPLVPVGLEPQGAAYLDTGTCDRNRHRNTGSCDLNRGLCGLDASLQASFYAEVQCHVIYVHVCWRMLTYADVC